MKAASIAERVEVAGVRPATFKLIDRGAPGSFWLYRSSRRIGTASAEPDSEWTARFEGAGEKWVGTAGSAVDLLRLVGTWLLTGEARDHAARPVEQTHPELKAKGRRSQEEKLSAEFLRRGQAWRLAQLDEQLDLLRKRIRRAPQSDATQTPPAGS